MLTGAKPQGYELRPEDIGRVLSHSEGFGRVLEGDVGKRIWRRPYGFAMENEAQRDKRKTAERMTTNRIDEIRFHARCCYRAGRSLSEAFDQIGRMYGHSDLVVSLVSEEFNVMSEISPAE